MPKSGLECAFIVGNFMLDFNDLGWRFAMTCRLNVFLAAFAAAAVVPVGGALAQSYPSGAAPGYRGAPPPSLPDNGPGFWTDNDDDGPVFRNPFQSRPAEVPSDRGMRGPAVIQATPRDGALPPPGFASPDGRPVPGGHQFDDTVAPRPPSALGPGGVSGQAASATPATGVMSSLPPEDQPEIGAPKELPPQFRKQLVDYPTKEPAGTIIIDTPNTYLFLVLGDGKALRYGIGVGREGFTWTGAERVSRMAQWPDWHPPSEMIERQPYLPRFMAGGDGNPLGARALYLGKTLYRIHGTNQPSTIGSFVSSGCIRLTNQDIEDLYSRVQVGTRVVVLPGGQPPATASAAPNPASPMVPAAAAPMQGPAGGLPPVRDRSISGGQASPRPRWRQPDRAVQRSSITTPRASAAFACAKSSARFCFARHPQIVETALVGVASGRPKA